MKIDIKSLVLGILFAITIAACARGSRSVRLTQENAIDVDPWEFCTPEMIPDYKGKMCLLRCVIKLKKNGDCKDGKIKWIVKPLKEEHEFFMGRYIAVRENTWL